MYNTLIRELGNNSRIKNKRIHRVEENISEFPVQNIFIQVSSLNQRYILSAHDVIYNRKTAKSM